MRKLCLSATIVLLPRYIALAVSIAIPNNDFSSITNVGSIGGGVLGGSGSNVSIGSTGPWVGTYSGIAALLAPPTLTIGSGRATISGLAGSGVVNVVNNSGFFFQTLTNSYASNTSYALSVDITSSQNISLSILGNGNAGVALTGSSGILASTTSAPANQLSIAIIDSTTTRVTLQFTTGATAPSGSIGLELFAVPNGVANASLLSSVSFDNVILNAIAVPEPSTLSCFVIGILFLLINLRFRQKIRL